MFKSDLLHLPVFHMPLLKNYKFGEIFFGNGPVPLPNLIADCDLSADKGICARASNSSLITLTASSTKSLQCIVLIQHLSHSAPKLEVLQLDKIQFLILNFFIVSGDTPSCTAHAFARALPPTSGGQFGYPFVARRIRTHRIFALNCTSGIPAPVLLILQFALQQLIGCIRIFFLGLCSVVLLPKDAPQSCALGLSRRQPSALMPAGAPPTHTLVPIPYPPTLATCSILLY